MEMMNRLLLIFQKVPSNIEKIVFAVTIYEADSRMQNFGMVSNIHPWVNEDTGEEIARYDLGEDYSTETSMVLGELYRHNGGMEI